MFGTIGGIVRSPTFPRDDGKATNGCLNADEAALHILVKVKHGVEKRDVLCMSQYR